MLYRIWDWRMKIVQYKSYLSFFYLCKWRMALVVKWLDVFLKKKICVLKCFGYLSIMVLLNLCLCGAYTQQCRICSRFDKLWGLSLISLTLKHNCTHWLCYSQRTKVIRGKVLSAFISGNTSNDWHNLLRICYQTCTPVTTIRNFCSWKVH